MLSAFVARAGQTAEVLNDTLKDTLTTVSKIQSAAQGVTQQAVTTSADVINSVLGVASNASGMVNDVGEGARSVVGTASKTTSALVGNAGNVAQGLGSVVETATQQGSEVTNVGLQQVGTAAKEALSLTGETLTGLFATANFLVLKGSQNVRAKNKTTMALGEFDLITSLKDGIKSRFNTKMREFMASLQAYSAAQKSFISKLISIYAATRCTKGVFYGRSCPLTAKTATFEKQLELAMKSSSAAVSQLKSISNTADLNLVTLDVNNPLEEYKDAAFNALKPLYLQSAGVYSDLIQKFSTLTQAITAADLEAEVGGRTRRKGRRKGRRKSRRRSKKYRRN